MTSRSPTLDSLVRGLRTQWRLSPLPDFFSWWARGLASLMPARWRAWWTRGPVWYRLCRDRDGGWSARRMDGHTAAVRLPAGDQDGALNSAWKQVVAGVDRQDLRTVLCLPPQKVLRRYLHLPAEARADLRRVAGYDVDRQTPFSTANAFFDVRLCGRTAAGNLEVELVVVPHAELTEPLRELTAAGVTVDAVDVSRGDGRLGANLLDADARPRRRQRHRRANRLLLAAAVILALLCMGQWLHNRHAVLATMQARVATTRAQARKVAALRRKVTRRLGAAHFVAHRRRHAPRMIDVLADITHRLPDSAWLERFGVDAGRHVSLQGQSPHATDLLQRVSDSPYLRDPGFSGAIQTDPGTGKERFYLKAKLAAPATTRHAEPAAATTAAPAAEASVATAAMSTED